MRTSLPTRNDEKGSVTLGAIDYTLTRSRRKTIAIYVRPDGSVEIRAPLRCAKSEIERFVKSKTQWIEKKQEQFALRDLEKPRELPPMPYVFEGEFEQKALGLVDKWSEYLGVSASYVGFRRMSTRWGSCTKKTRRMRLNSLLAYCPLECLEYLIVHELAHLKENNHSPRFWAIVEGALPDYKVRQKRLREHSWLLRVAE